MRIGAILAALALISCGGSAGESGETTATQESSGSESTESMEHEIEFDELSHDEQMAYMRDVVMPEMATLFREFDAEEFEEFTCATCHGENAQEVGFHMPNGLDPLPVSQLHNIVASGRPMPTFMAHMVVPRMAELLGEDPFDPATGQGFGCMDCHAAAPE